MIDSLTPPPFTEPAENIYTQTEQLYGRADRQLRKEGDSANLGGITLAHCQIFDTALAACLLVMGVPPRSPAPYTDEARLDPKTGSELGRVFSWWVGGESPPTETSIGTKTEWVLGAWEKRNQFETEHPEHELVHMRAALDAREWVKAVIFGRSPIQRLTVPVRGAKYFETDSINAASILHALGFDLLAANPQGPRGKCVFYFVQCKGLEWAEDVIKLAANTEGRAPVQWMAKVLWQYSHMISIAKNQVPILSEKAGDQTMILRADVKDATQDKFRRHFNQ